LAYAFRIALLAALPLFGACSVVADARATTEQVSALQARLQKELPGETLLVAAVRG
jgi:energy-converting hydrogenase Eha subunit H